MLATVIVPLYNASAHVGTLAKCLLAQRCRSFEAVFVDDGSADGTGEALQAALADARFPYQIVRQENGGVSAARNAGLALAKGEYVCFADADDGIPPDYLTQLLRGVRESGCEICLAQVKRVKSLPAALPMSAPCAGETLERDTFLREFLYRGQPYSICAGAFKRSLFERLSFPVGERYSEDVFVLWQALLKTSSVCVLRAPLYWYAEAGESAMSRMNAERLRAVRLIASLEDAMRASAPAFAQEYIRFAKARHAWSICWQAAAAFPRFEDFSAYCTPFEMKESMRAMRAFPGAKERLSASAYLVSPRLYHALARALLPKGKRRRRTV